jgi:phospholipid transport system substrate-binding protein
MRNLLTVLILVVLMGLQPLARADVLAPDLLIRDTVDEVLQIVKADREVLSNKKRLLELVDAKILPHFDFTQMTSLAMGKKKWNLATPEQQKTLTIEFRTLLVRTYTDVFIVYRDPKVAVKLLQMREGGNEATVRTVITLHDGRTATVDYDMTKTPAGWKAFDVIVEGVSLVISKRGEFADQIQQNGIEGLIKALADTNLTAASHSATQKKAQSN